jgi:hypothetical protein
VITDEMVEAAAIAAWRTRSTTLKWCDSGDNTQMVYRREARAALESCDLLSSVSTAKRIRCVIAGTGPAAQVFDDLYFETVPSAGDSLMHPLSGAVYTVARLVHYPGIGTGAATFVIMLTAINAGGAK